MTYDALVNSYVFLSQVIEELKAQGKITNEQVEFHRHALQSVQPSSVSDANDEPEQR